ncbi:hypothetical protein E2K80_09255 [Rhodophyticola sp. CCM32]|uniref:hypothetical protein n=1 Tax=Rhodophyticola sp. CCM32 TaxID=2916397 RepID=UPI00107F56C0|nr:hypothetical protein [Rhodophyticola sp. CCM32]QBY00890.1 hypothetical protein E2K80_09255 [Rhodophyticola sp. CCM32]
MRDDRHKWDFIDDATLPLTAVGVTIALAPIQRQTLVSGPRILKQFKDASGWPDVVSQDPYALAIRRDRVLLVDHDQVPQDGWHDDLEQAVSDATDAYSVYDISGPNAFELLKRGGEVSLAVPSRSVARLLFGMGVFLYPYKNPQSFRIHVGRAHGQAMLQSLLSCAHHLE